ncbi:hypothetical protein ACIB24_20035 [Spongisporangium articulatum]|uniref:Uncharacterized protein n=1 Tax=Spongisporangium articulatum TaxID=3362603 RepID=A0ABW8ASI6_9ACTN
MELILMLIAPFPIGYLVRNRVAGFVAYTALHAFVFTFQTAELILDWAGGSDRAFGAAFPNYEQSEVYAYGIVNLVIYAVGLGLLYLGQRVGTGRRLKAGQVSLDPVG